MILENLAKKTGCLPQVGKAIRNFYENRPPYSGLTSIMISFKYLVNETGIKMKEIKLKARDIFY